MLECLARFLYSAALEFLKQWLHDWGILLLTAVIAVAAAIQGLFAWRLYTLQRSIEESRLRPILFCRVKGDAPGPSGVQTSLEAQISNLSSSGIWIEEMFVDLDGPVAKPRMSLKLEMVLAASETKNWTLFSVPFANIVPLASTAPVSFKLQVKFHYTTASVIGIQTSPVYDVTVHRTVVTEFRLESGSKPS